jgi:hypothetical protein
MTEYYYVLFTHADMPAAIRNPVLAERWVIYVNHVPVAYSHNANEILTTAYRLNKAKEKNHERETVQGNLPNPPKPGVRRNQRRLLASSH